jgi:aminopeptidase YwaD
MGNLTAFVNELGSRESASEGESERFVSFGAEELGLLGSQAFVDSLSEDGRARIIAMLNFDTVGAGVRLGVLGDSQLTDLAVERANQRGINLEVSPGLVRASSGHASFAAVGIPVLMFLSNDSSHIHTERDTLDTINPQFLRDAVLMGLEVLEALADDSDVFIPQFGRSANKPAHQVDQAGIVENYQVNPPGSYVVFWTLERDVFSNYNSGNFV